MVREISFSDATMHERIWHLLLTLPMPQSWGVFDVIDKEILFMYRNSDQWELL